MVVRLRGRVFALGDYSVKYSVMGASRRDVQRIPKHWYFGPGTLDRVWERFDYPQGFLYSDTPEHWWTAPTPYGKPRLLWLLRLQ